MTLFNHYLKTTLSIYHKLVSNSKCFSTSTADCFCTEVQVSALVGNLKLNLIDSLSKIDTPHMRFRAFGSRSVLTCWPERQIHIDGTEEEKKIETKPTRETSAAEILARSPEAGKAYGRVKTQNQWPIR